MAFNPELGSTSPTVLLDNAERLDKLVNGPAADVPDRGGDPLYSWRQMMAKNDEIRQNLIPLSRQYMTLAAAQADIANIPDGSTTYVRSADWSSLADEYINNSGTLEATGRKMPSQANLDTVSTELAKVRQQTIGNLLAIQNITNSIADISPSVDVITDVAAQFAAHKPLITSEVQRLQMSITTLIQALAQVADDASAETAAALAVANAANSSAAGNTLTLGIFRAFLQQNQVAQSALVGAVSDLTSSLGTLDSISYEDFRLRTLRTFQMIWTVLSPLEGFDPENVATKDTSSTSQEMFANQYTFSEPGRVVRINITTPRVPANKGEGKVNSSVVFDFDGTAFTAYSTLEVQGASSAGYAKKNLNIALYSDAERKNSIQLKVGSLLPHDEWTFKANWIDHTHARNLASYRLWLQVMDSRKTWPMRDVEQIYVGATGSKGEPNGATGVPMGYPCITYVNGEFYGIGTIMIGKKRQNYNIAKNKPLEIWMGFDNWTDITNIDRANVDIKAPSKITDETEAALTAFQTFSNLPQANFTAQIDTVLNKNNAIDFYLFCDLLITQDLIGGNNAKNFIMITRDGVKWYFMPFDLDTVLGLEWNGKSIAWGPEYNYMTGSFWSKIRTAYKTDMDKRYADLRSSGIFSVQGMYKLVIDITTKYTTEMFEAEYARWPGLPSLEITSVDQILDWTKKRIAFLDTKYSYTGA